MVNKRDQKDEIAGQVVKPVNLVGYQGGSIVSRTIIDKDIGTLTLFAFDEGQALSEHTVPFDALVFIIDGKAEVTISGRSLNLAEGEMAVRGVKQLDAAEVKS
jgi:quercetin dioxygenase-like cupin family protein